MFRKRAGDVPFEGKPRLARKPSFNGVAPNNKPEDTDGGSKVLKSDSKARLDFNPMGGVTFRENHNPDVQIIGKGYGDDVGPESINKPQILPNKPREKKLANRTAAQGMDG